MATEIFQLYPWVGGLNLAEDPSTIASNELIQADNVVFGTRGSRKKREGINFDWDDQTANTDSVIGLFDFWYGNTGRSQKRVAVWDTGAIYTYADNGTRSADLFAGTAWGSATTQVSFEVINNLLIICSDGSNNVVKKYDGTTVADLGGTPPDASICRLHQGRLFTNDKDNLDRLHFSPVADPSTWNGIGDSGAIDVGKGDGDKSGITAIFPTFQGDLFVAKATKLYRISGYSPETWTVTQISDSIGCISHNSIVSVDDREIYFLSEKGIHTLSTTANYGDFESTFVSAPIQPKFSDQDFPVSRLKYCQGVYLPTINSVAFALTDSTIAATYNNTIYLYNIYLKAWYCWPNVACESLATFRDSDQVRFYCGTNTGKVAKGFSGQIYDVNTAGTNTAISLILKTGRLHVGQVPFGMKGFKRVGIIYAPEGQHTITVSVKIDNLASYAIAFSEDAGGDLLDVSFVLNQSALASGSIPAPYVYTADGYGRSIQLTISQSGVSERAEILGLLIEYEPAGLIQEVI